MKPFSFMLREEENAKKQKASPKPVVEPIPEVRPKKNLAAVLAKPKPLQRAAKAPTQVKTNSILNCIFLLTIF